MLIDPQLYPDMSGSFLVFLFVTTLVFLTVVVPIWLVMHYRSKRLASTQLNEDERHELEILADKAESFAERIEVLEAILDDQVPDWRKDTDDESDDERSRR